MTECNGCGACCEPFVMVYSPYDLVRLWDRLDPDERDFYRSHLSPMRRSDGRAMTPWNSGFSELIIEGRPQLIASHYYKCDNFDTETRRCTDYDNRPDVCRGFPWFGQRPDTTKVLPPTCSYRADIGEPVEPMPVAMPVKRTH